MELRLFFPLGTQEVLDGTLKSLEVKNFIYFSKDQLIFFNCHQCVLLSFTDAMAIVRKYGKPDLFITMTASADWPEIRESLFPGENSFDRPDVVGRVFEMKAQELIKDIEHGGVLGISSL